MKNFYIFIFFFVVLATVFKPSNSFAQIDTRFWFAAPEINTGHGDRSIYLRFSTLDKAATIIISMPKDPTFPVQVFNLAAFATGELDLTTWINKVETPRMTNTANPDDNANRNYTIKHPNGILIESTTKITAYYEVARDRNADIFALKGKNGLGTDFWVPMQTAWVHQSYTPTPHSGFVIVATEDGTVVTVKTTKTTESLGGAGTYIINLDRGEAFNVAASFPTPANVPAGSHVTSNKPIAVTLFHDTIKSGKDGCHDVAGDQLVPTNIVGKEYIVMRGSLGVNGTAQPEKVYILATEPNTTININRNGTAIVGVIALAGDQYVLDMDDVTHPQAYITSDKAIYVLHMSGYGCETGAAILPPIECTGSRLVQVKRSTGDNFTLTLLVKDGGEDDFSLNGGAVNTAIPASAFTTVLGVVGWKSARISLTTAQVATLGVASIRNSTTLFHLGVTNGGSSNSCRYGYFSSFNSLNLGPDIAIFYGSTTTLDAETFGAVGYEWNTDPPQYTAQIVVDVRRTKNYIVKVDLGQCIVTDEICVGTIEYVWVGDYKVAGVLTRDYGDFKNWSAPCGQTGIPDCNQDIVIPALVNGVAPESFPIVKTNQSCRNIIIEDGANITINPNQRLDVCGDIVHAGTLFMPLTSQLQFIGKQPQTYTRTATGKGNFENLIINNQTILDPRVKVSDAGTQNMVISKTGSLVFNQGILRTEGNKEVVVHNPSPTAISGFSLANASTSNFVGGKLRRAINTLGEYNFPVGLAVENIGAATSDFNKQAIIANNNTPANWIQPTGTNSTYCNLNPLAGNHVIHLSNNDANVSDAVLRRHIQFPSNVAVLGDNNRTLEAWVSLDPTPTNGGAIFYMGNDATKQLFALKKIAGNNFQLDLGGGLTQDIIYGSPLTSATVATYNWHHFAMSYNGSAVKVYIDGTEVLDYPISNLQTTLNASTVNKFFVGRYKSSVTNTNWYLAGKYDNIRIWNVAKTQAEVSTNSCVRFECTIPPELIGNYDIEDGSGFAEHKTRNCSISPLRYERAKVEFQTPITDAKYLLSFFNQYGATPNSPTEYRCQATFGSCPALNHGFWTISAYADSTLTTKVTGNANYRLTLYNNAYTNACTSPNAAIMKRNTDADPWSIPNFPALCFNNSLNATSMEWMSGFSDFGVPQTLDPVVLPVDLISLTAKPLVTTILVEWKTTNEINNKGFEVLRSTDGIDFTKVGWIAQNNTGIYNFEDFEVNSNQIYYYHLNQIDDNERAKASPVVNAKIDASMEGGINVYPNPTSNEFTIDLGETYTANTTYQIEIYTSIGMRVKSKTITNSSKINMSLEGLAKGMYLIKVITPSRTKFVKLQKE